MAQYRKVKNGNVTLQAVTYGDIRNAPIVLVHGYPDNHTMWEDVARQLAPKHFVITYDVRGAGGSSSPRRKADYRVDKLSDDLKVVVDTLIPNQDFHLVGHDWGSIQSWESVTSGPLQSRILSYTSISGPCLDHVGYWLRNQAFNLSAGDKANLLQQLLSSWYVGMFHLPVLAPIAWQNGLDKVWQQYLKHREGVEEPRLNATQGKDGSNGVQLYRANVLRKLLNPEPRYAKCPVQLIVPTNDHYVRPQLLDNLHQWVPELYRREINADHWVTLTHPSHIANWIMEFVRGIDTGNMTTALEQLRVRPERVDLPLNGKVAVITGAGSGFGRAAAVRLATAGANIVCVDIDETGALATAEQVRDQGASAWAQTTDVGSATAMQQLAKWVNKELGGADIVINNAGIGMAGGVLETDTRDWNRILKVNLWGVIHGSRLFGQQMVNAQRGGHIINVSSAAAFAPNRKLAAYATSKSAVYMFSECLRAELAEHGIGVTTLCPGFVATGIAQKTVYAGLDEHAQAKKRAKAEALYEKGAFVTPEDVADRMLDAILTNPALSLIGPEARLTRFISRFAPSVGRLVARIDITP